MQTNTLPRYDSSDNPTNCCPRFRPEGWDDADLHFDEKLFVKAETKSVMHVPINMGKVFTETITDIMKAGAHSDDDFIVLSYDASKWKGEHFFSVTHEVPDHEMVRLSGDYVTRVFEGPYRDAPKWMRQMNAFVRSKGLEPRKTYFFYTTCPKCAKVYGENYVVGVAEVEPAQIAA